MKDVQILIADSNEDFAVQVQQKIESAMGSVAEVTIITDREYLFRFFETPRRLDVLLIDQKMYFRSIERHNIEWIYILTEDPDADTANSSGFLDYIYRFAGLKTIVDKVLSGFPDEEWEKKSAPGKCKLIAVASPCGGSGKTTTALTLCAALRKKNKKTLFVDTTNMQMSSCWLCEKKSSKDDSFLQDHLMPDAVKKIIEHGLFDYVCPFSQTLPALGITGQEYIDLLQYLVQDAAYDYIVIDTTSDFTEQLAQWMSMAHTVLLLVLQDRFSAEKLQKFRAGADCSDPDKFRLICAMYRPERKNYLCAEEIAQYIPFANFSDTKDLKLLEGMQCYKKLAAMVM